MKPATIFAASDPAVRLLQLLGMVKVDLSMDPLEQAKTAIKEEADLLLA